MGSYLNSVIKEFEYYKELGNRTFNQIEDADIDWKFDPESNSISVIVKHIAGNIHSRWTNFLTEDGEKSWRNRDDEFVASYTDKHDMIQHWEKAWSVLFEVLNSLDQNDLEKLVYIRNEGHTVTEAINRQLAHYSFHLGQIVLIGKMIRGNNWETLSIPRGQSNNFNREYFSRKKGRRHFTDEL